jgi:hypothetical protein
MTVNTHPEPQPLSQDTDEQSTVAAPDESRQRRGGEAPACRNPAAGVEKLEAPQDPALAFRMVPQAAPAPEPPERKPKRTFSRR